MNKNEFYKELMSEYTFDHEKIKAAAMGNQKPALKFSFVKKTAIGVVAAAAVIAVTVGTTALLGTGSPVSVAPTSTITPSERFRMAAELYDTAESNEEEVFLYVTFKAAETPDDMQRILSETDNTGKIKVVSVFTSGHSEISGSDNIEQLFLNNEQNIAAVKIRCPASFTRSLGQNAEVWLVETDEAFKDSPFSVMDTNGEYSDHPIYESSEPENNSSDNSDDNSSDNNSIDIITDNSSDESKPVIGDTTPPPEQ